MTTEDDVELQINQQAANACVLEEADDAAFDCLRSDQDDDYTDESDSDAYYDEDEYFDDGHPGECHPQ